MRRLDRRFLLALPLAGLCAAGILWAASTSQATIIGSTTLPAKKTIFNCNVDIVSTKDTTLEGVGTFSSAGRTDAPQTVAEAGEAYISRDGLKTVPLKLLANGGHNFAEGVGDTHYWLDGSRPVEGAIWEKKAGTEFPAIQETRFHFLYTVEALPGRVFRSVNPAIMRADDVTSFPPPPGTEFRLVKPVDLEDMDNPGVVVGRVLSNRATVSGG